MKSARFLAWLTVFLGTVLTGCVHAASESSPPVNPDPAHLVWIKAGTFMMGSPTNEMDRDSDEGPQTRVTLSKGFWMGRYETTQEEYLAVMGSNPSCFTGDLKLPVETISWHEATNYCGRLTDREREAGRLPVGYVYRLPTEAEWEYCCRAGTTTRFSHGDDDGYTQLHNYAWHWDNSGSTTHLVGQSKPNAWGLYDMHGNVWEWCLDLYSGSLPGGTVTDPKGSTTGSARVLRGGSWDNNGCYCRSANRIIYAPDYWDYYMGFRPVLAPGQ